MRPRPFTARLAALLGALALLVGSCSSGDGSSDASNTDTESGPVATGDETDPARPAGSLEWEPCGGEFECATLDVPLDYGQPDGETIEIAISRLPANDQDDKIGTLFVNPGGPGASAIEFLQGGGFPSELSERFDLAAIDPRGVGRSAPVECGFDPTVLYRPDPTMEDQADRTEYLAVADRYVDQCEAAAAELLPHVGSRNTVRDMDEVRRALGEDKLNFMGFSYGTVLGATYADLFPENVRAIVLDGVVDTSKTGIEGAEFQASGFETALDNYAEDCDAELGCPAGPDAVALFERVQAKVEAAPIPAPEADRSLGPGEFALGTAQAMYSEQLWSRLSEALAAADAGDGSGLVELANDYLRVDGGGQPSSMFDAYFAIGCIDIEYPRDPQAILDAGEETDEESPHFGEAIVNDYARCGLWPVVGDPITPPEAEGSPPILVVGTTGDPATPYQASVDMAERLPEGALVTYEGDGHVAFGTSACATDAIVEYLVELTVPDEDPRCTE